MNLLHLEDSPNDAKLIELVLTKEWPQCRIQRVTTRAEYQSAIKTGGFDLILSDYSMPAFDGLSALDLARVECPDKPFIFISGTIGDERATAALKRGAADSILKDRPSRLVPAIRQALALVEEAKLRRQAEDRLHEQASLLDKARDAIIATDLEHRITYWNASAERLYGWTSAEVLGQKIEAVGLGYDQARFSSARTELLAHGEWRGDFRLSAKSGATLQVESTWSLVLSSDGHPRSILFIDTDVTEKKKFEAELLRAQRMENIGMLAGGVAHDLNNALSPILMATELLHATCPDPKQIQLLDMIRNSAKRGADMVKQILTFARGSDGAAGVVQIKALLREMVDICRQTFPKTIEIRTKIAPDAWTLLADSTQLHQVLLNLCINARDAMPEGGVLVLSASNARLDETHAQLLPASKPGPYVIVTATDTGIGMTPEVCAHIFEPFFTTKSTDKGTGLGLFNVQSIVKGLGGFVTVKSTPGSGTEFKIYLPAETASATPTSTPERPAHLMGDGEWILVVDDEAAIRSIAAQTLEMFGYHVLTAADGAQAVALCAEHQSKLRVMITDMTMPVMDGRAAIRAVRSLSLKMRIITASGLDADLRSAGADEHHIQGRLPKPYSADQLLQTVRDVLQSEEP